MSCINSYWLSFGLSSLISQVATRVLLSSMVVGRLPLFQYFMASGRTSTGGVGILVNILKLRACWEKWIHIFMWDWAGLNLCLPYEEGKCSPCFNTKFKVGCCIFYAASEVKVCSENAKHCREV